MGMSWEYNGNVMGMSWEYQWECNGNVMDGNVMGISMGI